MADKKKKNQKGLDHEQQKTPETKKKSLNVSDVFLDELKGAFTTFDKLSDTKKIELYGKKEYLEQFWEYFQKGYPHLLDSIDKQDLPLYIKALENK